MPTDVKVELVDRLVGAGLRAVEVTSFVSPKWVPQLADARDVLARVRPPPPGVRFSVLTPNMKARRSVLSGGHEGLTVRLFSASHGQESREPSEGQSMLLLREAHQYSCIQPENYLYAACL